ncbi:MAG: hypothetical protein K2Y56_08310 [Methylobacterium sp.]|uniref:hypothetical protein n=1 Tax=Methylobacterium sp. TaxID=409 RepID=UPI0025F92EDB|nr:hypothetical protein [Methylobacterium sp.]MBX9931529.1 hypothetical protein [Methylobacterium sp.]
MLKTTLSVLALASGLVSARADDVARFRGTIEATDRTTLKVRPQTGEPVGFAIAEGAKIFAATDGKLTDIKPESYIGSAAIPQPDGTLKAVQVTVFASSLRGTAPGHNSWDLGTTSTVTNGAVSRLSGRSGRTVTVQYKGGEKTIAVPPDVPVSLLEPGDKSLIVKGAKVVAVTKAVAGGKREAVLIIVGRNGTTPSM